MSQRPSSPDPRELFPKRSQGDAAAALAAVVAGVASTGAAVTYRLAFRLGYAPILGPPLLRQALTAWLYLAAGAAALAFALRLLAGGRRWAALRPPPVPSVPRWRVGALRTTEVVDRRKEPGAGAERPSPEKGVSKGEQEG